MNFDEFCDLTGRMIDCMKEAYVKSHRLPEPKPASVQQIPPQMPYISTPTPAPKNWFTIPADKEKSPKEKK